MATPPPTPPRPGRVWQAVVLFVGLAVFLVVVGIGSAASRHKDAATSDPSSPGGTSSTRSPGALGVPVLPGGGTPGNRGPGGPAATDGSATRGGSSSTSPASGSSQHPGSAPDAPTAELPGGGRQILPRHRVVAYYGAPPGGALGVLGAGSPEQVAARIERSAAAYRSYGRPVLPAMELIATVAQGSPGPDHDYSAAIPASTIARYLRVAHEHHMLLVLDFQPGSSEFLPEVEADRRFLLDPSVSVALDPEWKVPPGQAPGNGRIGSASAASINAVGHYLSGLIGSHRLPDKLMIIHQFTETMLPDRQNIAAFPGLEETLHADGEGAPSLKRAVYRQLAFPTPRFHVGFKVFFTQDPRVMTPAEVMALNPRPDVITYQ